MTLTFRPSRLIAAALAAITFATNCVFANKIETEFWSERRTARLSPEKRTLALAGLPASPWTAPLSSIVSPSPRFTMMEAAASLPLNVQTKLQSLIEALPQNFGSVRSVRVPSTRNAADRIVIHVQDVHRNTETQNNISETLQALFLRDKPGVVALEGAFGPIDLSGFRNFPRQDVVRGVADFILKENGISGPIHALLASPAKAVPVFTGVDDRDHYEANVEAYKKSFPRLKDQKERWALLDRELNERKNRAFGSSLLQFDRQVQAYRRNKIKLGDYVRVLALSAPRVSPSTKVFLEALDIETHLDFGAVESQRSQLLARLVNKLDKTESSTLLSLGAAYRLGQIGQADFYRRLQSVCLKGGVRLGAYPAMDAYVRYVLLSERIDGEMLFREIRMTEEAAYAKLAKTADEKNLTRESRSLELTGKLLDFALTSDEWAEYSRKPLLSAKGNGTPAFDLTPFESFYREAECRDDAMAANLLRVIAAKNAHVAVLVTGGFHSRRMDDKLAAAGMTTLSFVPKITSVDSESGNAYLSVFSQEKTPLEKLFEGQKLFLAQSPALAIAKAASMTVGLTPVDTTGGDATNAYRGLVPQIPIEQVRVTQHSHPSSVDSDATVVTTERRSEMTHVEASTEHGRLKVLAATEGEIVETSHWMTGVKQVAWTITMAGVGGTLLCVMAIALHGTTTGWTAASISLSAHKWFLAVFCSLVPLAILGVVFEGKTPDASSRLAEDTGRRLSHDFLTHVLLEEEKLNSYRAFVRSEALPFLGEAYSALIRQGYYDISTQSLEEALVDDATWMRQEAFEPLILINLALIEKGRDPRAIERLQKILVNQPDGKGADGLARVDLALVRKGKPPLSVGVLQNVIREQREEGLVRTMRHVLALLTKIDVARINRGQPPYSESLLNEFTGATENDQLRAESVADLSELCLARIENNQPPSSLDFLRTMLQSGRAHSTPVAISAAIKIDTLAVGKGQAPQFLPELLAALESPDHATRNAAAEGATAFDEALLLSGRDPEFAPRLGDILEQAAHRVFRNQAEAGAVLNDLIKGLLKTNVMLAAHGRTPIRLPLLEDLVENNSVVTSETRAELLRLNAVLVEKTGAISEGSRNALQSSLLRLHARENDGEISAAAQLAAAIAKRGDLRLLTSLLRREWAHIFERNIIDDSEAGLISALGKADALLLRERAEPVFFSLFEKEIERVLAKLSAGHRLDGRPYQHLHVLTDALLPGDLALIARGAPPRALPLIVKIYRGEERKSTSVYHTLKTLSTAMIAAGFEPSALPLIAGQMNHFDQMEFLLRFADVGKMALDVIDKHKNWNNGNLSWIDASLVSKFAHAANGPAFVADLKRRAESAVQHGFDYDDDEQLALAYIGMRLHGFSTSDVFKTEFNERVKALAEYDKKHPGSFKRLFTKTKDLHAIVVSSSRTRQLNTQLVDWRIVDDRLQELRGIKERIDGLAWLAEDFPNDKALNIRNLCYQRRKEKGEGTTDANGRFHTELPKMAGDETKLDVEAMKKELLGDKKTLYSLLFGIAHGRLKGQKEGIPKYLTLLRDLIVSEIFDDTAMMRAASSEDSYTRVSHLKVLFDDYVTHLPYSVGLDLKKIGAGDTKLTDLLSELSAPIYREISKVTTVETVERDAYTLEPVGFLSVFRGRAAIVDSSFDFDNGAPFANALQKDTINYLVRKGSQLKGYVSLTMGKDSRDLPVLTIDSIQSPMDGRELLMNLLTELNSVALQMNAVGVALPEWLGAKDRGGSFNLDNRDTIAGMKIYQDGVPVRVRPLHRKNWKEFEDSFGKDEYNSHSMTSGAFILLRFPNSPDIPYVTFDGGAKRAQKLVSDARLSPARAAHILRRLDEAPEFIWKYLDYGVDEKPVPLENEKENAPAYSGLRKFLNSWRRLGGIRNWSLSFHAHNNNGEGDAQAYLQSLLSEFPELRTVRDELASMSRVRKSADEDELHFERCRRDVAILGFCEGLMSELEKTAAAPAQEETASARDASAIPPGLAAFPWITGLLNILEMRFALSHRQAFAAAALVGWASEAGSLYGLGMYFHWSPAFLITAGLAVFLAHLIFGTYELKADGRWAAAPIWRVRGPPLEILKHVGRVFAASAIGASTLLAAFPAAHDLTAWTIVLAFAQHLTGTILAVLFLRVRARAKYPQLTLAINLRDMGAKARDGNIVTVNGLKEAAHFLPRLAQIGIGSVYLYNGLFKVSPLSSLVHTVSNADQHFPSVDGRVTVTVRNYRTKKENRDGTTVDDGHGNPFAPLGMHILNPELSGEKTEEQTLKDLQAFLAEARRLKIKVITDFVPWLAPDAIDETNLNWTFYRTLTGEQLAQWGVVLTYKDDELARRKKEFVEKLLTPGRGGYGYEDYAVVLRKNAAGVEEPVLVRHLSGVNKDQVIPNIFSRKVQDYYFDSMKRLIDLGVGGVRIDLAHCLLKDYMKGHWDQVKDQWENVKEGDARVVPVVMDGEPFMDVLKRIKTYAQERGRTFDIILESYDQWHRDMFDSPEWEKLVDTIYYKDVFDNYEKGHAENLRESIKHALNKKSRRWIFPSNYDEESLKNLYKSFRYDFLALLFFLSQCGVGAMLGMREALDHSGDFIAVVGPAHPSSTHEEFRDREKKGLLKLFNESPVIKILEKLPALVKGSELMLNTNDQNRLIAMAAETVHGSWAITITDLSRAPPERETHPPHGLWVSAPPAFLNGARVTPFSPDNDVHRAALGYELINVQSGAASPLEMIIDRNDPHTPYRIQMPPIAKNELNSFVLRRRATADAELQKEKRAFLEILHLLNKYWLILQDGENDDKRNLAFDLERNAPNESAIEIWSRDAFQKKKEALWIVVKKRIREGRLDPLVRSDADMKRLLVLSDALKWNGKIADSLRHQHKAREQIAAVAARVFRGAPPNGGPPAGGRWPWLEPFYKRIETAYGWFAGRVAAPVTFESGPVATAVMASMAFSLPVLWTTVIALTLWWAGHLRAAFNRGPLLIYISSLAGLGALYLWQPPLFVLIPLLLADIFGPHALVNLMSSGAARSEFAADGLPHASSFGLADLSANLVGKMKRDPRRKNIQQWVITDPREIDTLEKELSLVQKEAELQAAFVLMAASANGEIEARLAGLKKSFPTLPISVVPHRETLTNERFDFARALSFAFASERALDPFARALGERAADLDLLTGKLESWQSSAFIFIPGASPVDVGELALRIYAIDVILGGVRTAELRGAAGVPALLRELLGAEIAKEAA